METDLTKDQEQEHSYEFIHDLKTEKPTIYTLLNPLENQRRLKAFITKDEYENKIPKLNQKYYKEVN